MLNKTHIASIAILLSLAVAFASPASAQTAWYVDDDAPGDPGPGSPGLSDPLENGAADHPFDALQEALDAAVPGDEIIVADGVYSGAPNRNLDFAGKAVRLASSGGADACIIDCGRYGPAFVFDDAETADAMLEGFTILSGVRYKGGGGVYCYAGSPTISDCIIADCRSGLDGGGVYLDYDSCPTFNRCVIRDCSAYRHGGGLICRRRSAPTFTDCAFTGNTAGAEGGGLRCAHNSPAVFTNCTFSDNHAEEGGALCCAQNAAPSFANCTFSENSAQMGAGLYCMLDGAPSFTNCSFTENSAQMGAGLYCLLGGAPSFTNCSFTENSAQMGAGLYCLQNGAPVFTRCNLRQNHASRYGGAVYSYDDADPRFECCIFNANTAANKGPAAYCCGASLTFSSCTSYSAGDDSDDAAFYLAESSLLTAANSIFWDLPETEFLTDASSSLDVSYSVVKGGCTGPGCIADNPRLYDPDGPDDEPGASDDCLWPRLDSPCLDAGYDDTPVGLPAADYEGHARSVDADDDGQAVTDIGAYEYQPDLPRLCVSHSEMRFIIYEGEPEPTAQTMYIQNGGGVLLQWTAQTDCDWLRLSTAAAECDAGEIQILDLNVDSVGLAQGEYSCLLTLDGLNDEQPPTEIPVTLHVGALRSVPDAYPSIGAAMAAADNYDTILVADGMYSGDMNRNLRNDGRKLAIRSMHGPHGCFINCQGIGSGFILNTQTSGSVILDGFTISQSMNPAITCSGGVAVIQNCIIETCYAAGIKITNDSHLNIQRCRIANCANEGLHCSNSEVSVYESAFYNNYKTGYDKPYGTYLDASVASFYRCTFIRASDGCFEGIEANNSEACVLNCTFTAKRPPLESSNDQPTLLCRNDARLSLINSILWNCSADPIQFDETSTASVSYCNIQSGWPGEGNISSDPGFLTDLGYDSIHAIAAGRFPLRSDSPCIDAGAAPYCGHGLSDVFSSYDIHDGDGDGLAQFDMGACEFDCDAAFAVVSPLLSCTAPVNDEQPLMQISLRVKNIGPRRLDWDFEKYESWLQVAPASGSCPPGDNQEVVMTFDATGLEVGAYYTTVRLKYLDEYIDAGLNFFVGRALHVPAQYPVIQAALDAAQSYDTIYVADGVYTGEGNREITFPSGRGVSLRSENGPHACIIDCEGAGQGVHMRYIDPVLQGFTIRNGYAENGGAVQAGVQSRAIGFSSIKDCIFQNNKAAEYGGAVFVDFGRVNVENCIFENNIAGQYGGGLRTESGFTTYVRNCSFINNTAGVLGGGAACLTYDITFLNCLFASNHADQCGGGLTIYRTTTMNACRFLNNTSGGVGGALRCASADASIVNSLFAGNSAQTSGGAIYTEYYVQSPDMRLQIANSTIVDNYSNLSLSDCGAVALSETDASIANTILWNPQLDEIVLADDLSTCAVSYSNVHGGYAGPGNFDADPLFVDPDGPDDEPDSWLDNDYRLQPFSPCVDAADNALVPLDALDLDADGFVEEHAPFDLHGRTRFRDMPYVDDAGLPDLPDYPHVADIGACEFQTYADFNDDDCVNLSDLAHMLGRYGQTGMTYNDGDLDGDADIDLQDLATLLALYGQGCP